MFLKYNLMQCKGRSEKILFKNLLFYQELIKEQKQETIVNNKYMMNKETN